MKTRTSFTKKKTVSLGFRTPGFFRGSTFSPRGSAPRFDPARFKTQHKG